MLSSFVPVNSDLSKLSINESLFAILKLHIFTVNIQKVIKVSKGAKIRNLYNQVPAH